MHLTWLQDELSSWETAAAPLWGTFCGHCEGEWLGQYSAYTPWGGEDTPDSQAHCSIAHSAALHGTAQHTKAQYNTIRHSSQRTNVLGSSNPVAVIACLALPMLATGQSKCSQ